MVHSVLHRVGGHVRAGGRRRGGMGQGPADFVSRQGKALPKREEDGVNKVCWFGGKEMVKESPIKFRRS